MGPPMNHCEWHRHPHSWGLYFEKKIIVLMLLQIMSIQSFLVVPKLKSQTKKKTFYLYLLNELYIFFQNYCDGCHYSSGSS